MIELCLNMRLDFGLVRSQVLIKMGDDLPHSYRP